MHASPPLEPTPVTSYYYITDAQAGWPAAQQDAWLQKFNYSTLAVITSHEVMPGHYVHSVFMRKTPGKIRRIWIGLNPFPQPSSGQDGWAHYAEQMVVDEGFRASDPRYEMAQVSEALTRICRMVSGIRLHTGEWTVDRAAQFFEEKAHLPAPAARQEAERGTYDPTYGGYFLGKVAAFKLRADYQKAQGRRVQPPRVQRAGDDQRNRAVVGASSAAAARGYGQRPGEDAHGSTFGDTPPPARLDAGAVGPRAAAAPARHRRGKCRGRPIPCSIPPSSTGFASWSWPADWCTRSASPFFPTAMRW